MSVVHNDTKSIIRKDILEKMLSMLEEHPSFKIYKKDITTHAPCTLYPSIFSKALYYRAIELQPIWNELISSLTLSCKFIDWMVQRLNGKDDFVMKLYDIERQKRNMNSRACGSLAILRSDYMMHKYVNQDNRVSLQLKQVEINTMASSFGSLSQQLYNIRKDIDLPEYNSDSLIPCKSMDVITDGFFRAMQHYNKTYEVNNSVALMIVSENEQNFYDQQLLVKRLHQRYGLWMFRCTFLDIINGFVSICKDSGNVILGDFEFFSKGLDFRDRKWNLEFLKLKSNNKGTVPVSLVYYRDGYSPSSYVNEEVWACRANLELSRAIQCPSIATQLVGFKKAQQILAEPGVLEQFLPPTLPKHAIGLLRESFMGLYSLEDQDQAQLQSVISRAYQNPTEYLLKPQREGGGNNLAGQELLDFLKNHPTSDLNAWIMMEKIKSPQSTNALIRNRECLLMPTISELGIFGSVLWTDKIIHQSYDGYLLRTKAYDVSEGGVAAGYAYLDSLLLVDDSKIIESQ
jgi:glutathione synthetase